MKIILLCLLCCFSLGCAKLQHLDELMALQSFSDNQDAQKRYLEQEEKKFQNLLADIKQEKLYPGQSKFSIVSNYGKPILISLVKDDPVIKEELMYRHPGQLLGSEKVFLYFDHRHKLVKVAISAAR